ncbi:hypothetical protein [Mucilaginibacter celer]|uniref:Uncharacterized protein n=1 Tax=Mucilaginibacter celer TaxID=2305508 RepID=A0A494VWG4_9SPHI|nr:hypothetical protein [Mucilaginibacter celer]AYL98739.1 hypothetical protein HYN43_027230 [Mucilaginibacter celer]
MKKTLLAMAAVAFLLFAGCEKNNVAPKKDSVSTKSTTINAVSKGKDTIWLAPKTAPTPAKTSRDTIWLR